MFVSVHLLPAHLLQTKIPYKRGAKRKFPYHTGTLIFVSLSQLLKDVELSNNQTKINWWENNSS